MWSFYLRCVDEIYGEMGYLSPRPENPFIGISINAVCNRSKIIRNLIQQHRGSHYNGSMWGEKYEAQTCNPGFKIDEVIQNAMGKVEGLKLQDFLEKL